MKASLFHLRRLNNDIYCNYCRSVKVTLSQRPQDWIWLRTKVWQKVRCQTTLCHLQTTFIPVWPCTTFQRWNYRWIKKMTATKRWQRKSISSMSSVYIGRRTLYQLFDRSSKATSRQFFFIFCDILSPAKNKRELFPISV